MPDLTITLTVQQANRLRDAFSNDENPTPTLADLKQEVTRYLRGRVRQHERRIAESAIPDTPFDPT
jgi:hypothetical protein